MDLATKQLLAECNDAMAEATNRYRMGSGQAGNDPNVPGWVAWLDQMQVKIRAALTTPTGLMDVNSDKAD